MKLRVHNAIAEIPSQQWNQLVRDKHPFIRHEFLHAMELHHCVGEKFGWLPRHIALYSDSDELLGAMPLYEKYNSYGEFVFDHAWAEAYQRHGLGYYPKLVSAVPYTPARGQRLLAKPGVEEEVQPLLLERALQLTQQLGCSGFHCLFPLPDEHHLLSQQLLSRYDCQFHWQNRGYRDFEDFLQQLSAKKRKNIRQERRRAAASGVIIRRLDGASASDQDWRHFTAFYEQTFQRKWGMATFNHEFFSEVARQMPEQVLLILAEIDARCVAGALLYRSSHTLYGRHWGCVERIDALHFELCYYQGIEYCIEQGLQHFEPGAQGEHKLARGFLPTLTASAHWIVDPRFRHSIARYVQQEKEAVEDYLQQLLVASPYRQE